MPWKMTYLEDLKIIKTVYTDPLPLEELQEAALSGLALAMEKQTEFFLADCSALTQTGNTMDIYKLGAFLESISVSSKINIKEALILPPNAQNVTRDLKFFETVVNNRMIKAKIFQDAEEAIGWLIG